MSQANIAAYSRLLDCHVALWGLLAMTLSYRIGGQTIQEPIALADSVHIAQKYGGVQSRL